MIVEVLQSQEKLVHNVSSFIFTQEFIINDILEKFSSFAVLKDEETNLVPLPDLVEFNDVGVV